MTVFDVVELRGSAAELHALEPGDVGDPRRPACWVFDLTEPAVVLGSRQRDTTVDLERCRERGLQVAHRRSGGGAVFLRPAEIVWVDLWVPAGSDDVPDDVRGSMVWAGERWLAGLPTPSATIGTASATERTVYKVYTGGLAGGPWADLVCFAGTGPGEVLAGDHKLVGLSQRRTRAGARIQGMVYRLPPRDDDHEVFDVPVPPGRPPLPAYERDLDATRLIEQLSAPDR